MEKVAIKTDYIRLDQFLKFTGAAVTGGEAKIMIMNEMIKINGETAFERGKKLHKGDIIEISGLGKFEIE